MQNIITIDRQASSELKETAISCFRSGNACLQALYPNFDSWITEKVAPGLNAGTRKIIVSLTNNQISGFAIIKKEHNEKKLCCLRVLEEYQNRYGIGDKLFKKSFELLDTEKPLLSISEDMLPSYKKLFTYYGFAIESVYPEYYRPKKTEFCYNGELSLNSGDLVNGTSVHLCRSDIVEIDRFRSGRP